MENSEMRHMDMERLLKRSEAAEFIGWKTQTLANRAWKGQGPPFIRLSSRSIRYRLGDLLAWAKTHQVRPEAE
jgi:predicted DNA-binding transcriptional regulator AlpA